VVFPGVLYSLRCTGRLQGGDRYSIILCKGYVILANLSYFGCLFSPSKHHYSPILPAIYWNLPWCPRFIKG